MHEIRFVNIETKIQRNQNVESNSCSTTSLAKTQLRTRSYLANSENKRGHIEPTTITHLMLENMFLFRLRAPMNSINRGSYRWLGRTLTTSCPPSRMYRARNRLS